MSEKKILPKRDEVPEKYTWNLELIYPSQKEFEADLATVQKNLAAIKSFEGKLGESSKSLADFIDLYLEMSRLAETAYVYSHMKSDQDTSNDVYQGLNQKALSVYSELETASAFFQPELLNLSDQLLEQFYQEEERLKGYRTFLDVLRIRKEHVLDSGQEAVLAQASEALGGARKTFNLLNNADLTFQPVVDKDGNELELTHGSYSTLLESNDPNLRRQAFQNMYCSYISLKNTFASTLANNIKVHNFEANLRQYPSARNAALSANQVPEDVYDTLVSVVNEKLSLLHRYLALQKKAMGLQEMHMYDLYVPITGEAPFKYTYEEAVEETYKVLKPLGAEYAEILKEGFENRWIDVLENQGKRSGAYSSGGYSTKPYMLLNWKEDLGHFFTLVHEFGHSCHSYLTRANQPYVYGDYSIFLAEIASTTNENLLTEYLLNKYTDKESQKYILNSYLNRVKSTIFRQTQFAEFEHWMHDADQSGIALTQASLSEKYAEINKKYYGAEVVQDPEIAYEWARIPHFYMNYYVFQYATGMAAATALSKRILTEGDPAVKDYLAYLSAGRSDAPINIMKKAGVDMTQPQYLYDALSVFEERLSKLEALMNEE